MMVITRGTSCWAWIVPLCESEGADSEEISSLSLSRKPGAPSILISNDHRWWQEVEKGYHRLWPQATSLLSSVQAHVKTANVVPHLTKQSAWHGIRVGGSCEVANIPSWLWVFSKEKFVHNLRVKAIKVSRDVLKMMLLSLVQEDLFCQAAVTTQSSESAHGLYWTYSLSASIFRHFLGSWVVIYVTVISVSGYLLIPLSIDWFNPIKKYRTIQ